MAAIKHLRRARGTNPRWKPTNPSRLNKKKEKENLLYCEAKITK